MKYLKKYTLYERVSKETKLFESKKWYDDLLDKMKSEFHQFISNMDKEKDETKEAFKLIVQSAKGEKDLTDAEKKQIGDQMKDVLKTVGLTAASVLPGGTIYFLIIKLLKLEKFTLPSSFLTEEVVLNETSSVVLNNIEDIFREIEDLGFKVEYSLLASVNEVTRIYIEKFDIYGFNDELRPVSYIPGQEIVLALQHLISYVGQDYDIEIETICDSQCIDYLSSKSEDGLIENDARIIGEYKEPIDYIKIVISNK